ncbi:beta-defensin 13-like isoform X2 [Sciurus carolinensis]|uniref:Beta-defensin n=2 Tax=Sciurus TaxID=10001 RepID=A0A8D2B0X5_SCIVU|nr:beta-defensin 13-like isoform X2 [Sciurus carolinensis]
MSEAMRIFSIIFAGLILVAQMFPAGGSFHRRRLCAKLDGRCEAECLSFEVKIGGCRAELTPLCCKKKQKH